MKLRTGLTFCIAPRFYSEQPWSDRLQINGGSEKNGSFYYPRSDWREVSPEELGLLVRGVPPSPRQKRSSRQDKKRPQQGITVEVLSPSQIGLLAIPVRLRIPWWTIAEQADSLDDEVGGYETFVTELSAFLRFKGLPLPERCRCDVVANRPGQRAVHFGTSAEGEEGLGCSMTASADAAPEERLVCVINLGDEATHLVLLNLPLSALGSPRGQEQQSGNKGVAFPALLEQFCAGMPTYPFIRVCLAPGEGLWMPDCGIVYASDTLGKNDLDVLLAVYCHLTY